MKIIKKTLMVLMVLSMIVVFAGQASAKWYEVNVVYTNISDTGAVVINIERNARYRTFALPTAAEKSMLATALCAQTSGMQLKIEVVDFNADGSELTGMILMSSPAP